MKYDLNVNILPNNWFSKLWSCASATLMADSCSSWVILTFTTWVVISGVTILGDVAVLCFIYQTYVLEGKADASFS